MMSDDGESIIKVPVLHESERQIGASFALSYGWQMAQSYSGVIEEHRAVRASVGLIDLSYFGAIKVWGSEAIQFLNGLVTNDVKSLVAGTGMRAAFLTGHGKIRALCRILNLGEAFLIVTDPQTHEKVFNYVFPFSYAGDFKVEDVSEEYQLLSVQGPKARLIIKEVCFEPLPSLEEYQWFETLIAGHRALVTRCSHTGELGFDIFVPAPALKDLWDFILLKGHFHTVAPIGLEALDALRLEAAIPVYGIDVDETNMMLEIGLEDAVSFKKGCYTGQEAVAMATYRGHISKKLSGLRIEGDAVPKSGDLVKKSGKEIGHITSAQRSLSLGSTIALAYLKYGFFAPGNSLEIQSDPSSLLSEVVELPFHRSIEESLAR